MCYEGAWPEHHCKVADGALLNETIPKEEDGSYSKCKMYDADDRNKTVKCDQWEYFGYIGDTIVSEVTSKIYALLAVVYRPFINDTVGQHYAQKV